MQLISQDLSSALNSESPGYIKKILLYTRAWDNAQNKYLYNPPDDITRFMITAGRVKYKLDNEGYGVWNNASASFTFSNFDNNFSGVLHGAKVEIFAGSGQEYVKIMRGFILTAPVFNERERSITINISGELARLKNYPAEQISLLEERELLTADPGGEFITQYPAVAEILEVRRGALAQGPLAAAVLKEEYEYKISSLNLYGQGAAVKPAAPLEQGEALWATYRRWHTDKPVDWIARQIAELSDSESYDIDELSLNGGVQNFFSQPSGSAWDGQHFMTEVNGNNEIVLTESFLTQANFTWTVSEKPSVITFNLAPSSISITGNNFAGRATAWAPCSFGAYGTWQIEADCNWETSERQFNYFISSATARTNTNGYCFVQNKDGNKFMCGLYRVVAGQLVSIAGVMLQTSLYITRCIYRISRAVDGTFSIMVKPVNISLPGDGWHNFGAVCVDNTYKTSSYYMVSMSTTGNIGVHDIRHGTLASGGNWAGAPYGDYTGPVLDGNMNPTIWGPVVYEDDGFYSQVAYRSRAAEEAPWGNWLVIANGTAPSTQDRYLQLRWEASSSTLATQPMLKSWGITWQTNSIKIAVVNMAGMTFLDVMQELARFTGFQIGYDNSGKFLFKERSCGAPLLTLDKHDIFEAETLSDGSDLLFNRVKVNFGPYSCMIDNFTNNEPRPNYIDTYGVREYGVMSGVLLPPQNADFARAIAPIIYGRVNALKKRAAVSIRFLPQLELGDVIMFDYPGFLQCAMLVEGIELDFETWRMRVDLAEV